MKTKTLTVGCTYEIAVLVHEVLCFTVGDVKVPVEIADPELTHRLISGELTITRLAENSYHITVDEVRDVYGAHLNDLDLGIITKSPMIIGCLQEDKIEYYTLE